MEIKPITGFNATVSVPGSKSYTQRALIIAALAQGNSSLHNALISEDTGYVMDALKALGAEIAVDAETDQPSAGRPAVSETRGRRSTWGTMGPPCAC